MMEYIKVKHEVHQLRSQVADWQRRVEVAGMVASRH